MGATVVGGDDLDVLMPRAAISVLVLDPRVRKSDVPIVVRQLGFAHVTSTRILKPTHDRWYFYLVYGTPHFKGLVEFRELERTAVDEQERVRFAAKQEIREARTGQTELFTSDDVASVPASFEVERDVQRDLAVERLRALLRRHPKVRYEDALSTLLELPLVWEADIKRIILDLRVAGELDVVSLNLPKRTPKKGHLLVRRSVS